MTTSASFETIRWQFNALALFDQLRPLEQREAASAIERVRDTWRPGGPLPSQLEKLGRDQRGTVYLLRADPSLHLVIVESEAGRSVVDVMRTDHLRYLQELGIKSAVNE